MLLLILTLVGVVVILQIATLRRINQEEQRMSQATQQLDAAIAAEAIQVSAGEAAIDTLEKAVTKVDNDIDALIVKVNSGAPLDITAELTAIQANTSRVAAVVQRVTAASGAAVAADLRANPPPGLLTSDVANLSLSLAASPTAAINVSETNYAGVLSATSGTPAVATITPPNGRGPTQQFVVTAVAIGQSQISISDDHGTPVTVNVVVTA